MNATATTDRGRATPGEVAKHLSTTTPTILTWYRKGIIPAEVAEGRIYRFDLRKVDAALAARAKGKGDGQ